MSLPDPKPFQRHRNMGLAHAGTTVLSSSCSVLFIDRKAVALLDRLDPDSPTGWGMRLLPPSLMTVAQEIAASHSSIEHDYLANCPQILSVRGRVETHRSHVDGVAPRLLPANRSLGLLWRDMDLVSRMDVRVGFFRECAAEPEQVKYV